MKDYIWNTISLFLNTSFFSNKKSRIKRYAIPILFSLILLLLKAVALQIIPQNTQLNLTFIAVILSAWYGGFGPGLMATILVGIVNELLFIPPYFTLDTQSLESIAIFFIEGLLISILAEAKRQADMQKNQFIGIISHELKNPLTSIKSYTQILLKSSQKKKDKTNSNYLVKIDTQIASIVVMINDLLDLTRLESGKFSYTDEKFNIYDLLKDVVTNQRTITKSHKIQLTGKTSKTLYGDKQRIRQVIVNLLTNAIKYSPNADKVLVAVKNVTSGVEISVIDLGMGIPKKQINNVFKRFYRTSAAEKSPIKGLGLGLFIASEIIKQHDGKLWVTSSLGKGATFHIFLPAK